MSDALLRVVVQAAAFFERGDEDVLDQQTALRQLEWISWELKRLDPKERDEFLRFLRTEADRTDDAAYRGFLLEFPRAFGLADRA
jgi:hypothetical protein